MTEQRTRFSIQEKRMLNAIFGNQNYSNQEKVRRMHEHARRLNWPRRNYHQYNAKFRFLQAASTAPPSPAFSRISPRPNSRSVNSAYSDSESSHE